MTEKEYLEQVNSARASIAAGQLHEAEILLDQLCQYKPVRLLWYVAKAEYLWKTRGGLEAVNLLNDKFFLSLESPGVDACMELRLKLLQEYCETRDAVREEYSWRKTRGEDCTAFEQALTQALEDYAREPESAAALMALGDAFFHTADMNAYLIVRMEQLRTGALAYDNRDYWFYQFANFGYLEEKIKAAEVNTFILVMDEYMNRSLEALAYILSGFCRQVFLLMPPIFIETEERIDVEGTIAVSMENLEQYAGWCVISPVALVQAGNSYGDNRGYLIDYLCREKSREDNAVVLCSGHLINDLCTRTELRGRIGLLSNFWSSYEMEKLQMAWAGSYLAYISDIYRADMRQKLAEKPEVDFSIVIPARNSAYTLRYTLETCLKQNYQGSYEIIVSDNSVDEDTGVFELCQEFNDSRIHYVKTPRLLQLPKSFEFACLQAKGEFILPIGSDDGLLPWSLDVLKRVLDRYPQEDVIQWERDFYAWPSFNDEQENMLQSTRKYMKNQIPVRLIHTRELLNQVAQDMQMMYTLPLLYINSGFRKRYLGKIFAKTGKLWDGANQDLHMGILNCCINRRIPVIFYPLAIAGMSGSSLGYLGSRPMDGPEREKLEQLLRRQCRQENIGIYVCLAREQDLPPVGVDATSLYLVLSRAVEEGLLTEERADEILDWRTAVLRTIHTFSRSDTRFDWFLQALRSKAAQRGEADLQWFDRTAYPAAAAPRLPGEKQRGKKGYTEGIDALGGKTVDASQYGVQNIAQAAELLVKWMG